MMPEELLYGAFMTAGLFVAFKFRYLLYQNPVTFTCMNAKCGKRDVMDHDSIDWQGMKAVCPKCGSTQSIKTRPK